MKQQLLEELWKDSTGLPYPQKARVTYVSNFDIEDFAKAIIEECCKAGAKADMDYGMFAPDLIRSHFKD